MPALCHASERWHPAAVDLIELISLHASALFISLLDISVDRELGKYDHTISLQMAWL